MLRTLLLIVAVVLALAACGTADPPPSSTEMVMAGSVSSPVRWQPEPTTTTTTRPPPPTTTSTTLEPSTTTTMPPSPPPPAAGAGQVNGYPCGGDLPPCWVMRRESGGDPTAVNPTGCGGHTCGGLWQFDPRTWAGYGGFAYAQDAPWQVQNDRARQLWAGGAGCAHWAACG